MNPRVAYLINQHPAVSHTFIRREIEALERAGLQVVRFALRGWDADLPDEADRREQAKTRYVLQAGIMSLVGAFLLEAFRSPARVLRSLDLAARMTRGSDRPVVAHLAYFLEACILRRWCAAADVGHLHAHFATNSAEVAMLVHALGGPSYSFTAHGSDIVDRPAQVGLPLTVGHAAFVVAVCAFGRGQIFKWVPPALWGRVHVVRCGLPPRYGERIGTAPVGGRQIVCIGRMSSEKGQLLLVQAARQVAAAGDEVDLVFVGDGPTRAQVEAEIASSGLGERIRLAGALDAAGVERELGDAAVLVVPSLSEGLPVVVMEAMAAGRPVIAPYLGGIPELIVEGRNGWLYPAGDVAALAAAIRRFLRADHATLAQMSEAARSDVWTAHDVDVEASRLARLLRGEGAGASSDAVPR